MQRSPDPRAPAVSRDSGLRAGVVVLVASFVGHGANYLFYVVAARMLDVGGFAEISVLVAFSTLAFMPFNGLQAAAARDVSRAGAAGDAGRVSAYVRALLRRVLVVDAALLVVLVAASGPIAAWLRLESARLVWLTAVWIVLGTLLLVGLGVAQGLQRFGLVGLLLAGPLGGFRVALLPLCLLVAGVSGGLLAMVLATLLGLVLVAGALRRPLSVPPTGGAVGSPVGGAVVALIAFSALTNADLLVAKAVLPDAEAAVYASAALLGKVALFAPQALALVLLPRAAAALARGERADRQVLLTLAATAGCGLAVAAGLAVLPAGVLSATFGAAYVDAEPLLAALALVMTTAAVLNVHLMAAMARGSRRFPVLLVVAAAAHAALLAVLHGTPAQIITASAIAVGGATLVHETVSRHGAVRMLAAARRARPRA